MRWDSASGQYDMGFRNYDPGVNQFLSRDMYDSALADMSLTTDPFTGNRYTFGAGNPISNIELDGHMFPAGGGGGPSSTQNTNCPLGELSCAPSIIAGIAGGAGARLVRRVEQLVDGRVEGRRAGCDLRRGGHGRLPGAGL